MQPQKSSLSLSVSDKAKIEYVQDIITDETQIDELIPVIRIRDSIFAVKGDISVIGGLPKAGKTSIAPFILATSLKEFASDVDTLGIRSTFSNGKPVVYIDTEQPRSYTKKILNVTKRIIGVEKKPDNLRIINLRKYTYDVKRSKILQMMEDWPDAHIWIIDGPADLIPSVNDEEKSMNLIQELMSLADRLNTAIILFIHLNPGLSNKLRGHIGSDAERKCGAAITIRKIKEAKVHKIEPNLIRGSDEFEPILFEYDKEKGHMVSVGEAKAAEILKKIDKSQIKLEQRIQLGKRCTLTGGLKYKDLIKAIMFHTQEIEGKRASESTANNRIKELLENGILEKKGEFYSLTEKYR